MLSRLHQNRPIFDSKLKICYIVLFFFAIIFLSAGLSISLYEFINYLSES